MVSRFAMGVFLSQKNELETFIDSKLNFVAQSDHIDLDIGKKPTESVDVVIVIPRKPFWYTTLQYSLENIYSLH